MSRVPPLPEQSVQSAEVIPYAAYGSSSLPSRPGLITSLGVCGLVFGLLASVSDVVGIVGALRLFNATREPYPPPKVNPAAMRKPELQIPPYAGDMKHADGLFRPERERIVDVIHARLGINLDRCEMLRRLMGACGALVFAGAPLDTTGAIDAAIVESGTMPAGVDADAPPVFFRTRSGTVLLSNCSAQFTPLQGERIVKVDDEYVTVGGQNGRVRSAAGDAEHIRRLSQANPSLTPAQIGALAQLLVINDGKNGLIPTPSYALMPPRRSIYLDWRMDGESLEYQHFNGRMLILVNGAIVPQVLDRFDPLTGVYRQQGPEVKSRWIPPISRWNAGIVLASAIVDQAMAAALVLCSILLLASSRRGAVWFMRWVIVKIGTIGLGGYALACCMNLMPANEYQLIGVWVGLTLMHLFTAALLVLAMRTLHNPPVRAYFGLDKEPVPLVPPVLKHWNTLVERFIPAAVSGILAGIAAAMGLAGAIFHTMAASAADSIARMWHVLAGVLCLGALAIALWRTIRGARKAPAAAGTMALLSLAMGLTGVPGAVCAAPPAPNAADLKRQLLEATRRHHSSDRAVQLEAWNQFTRIFAQTRDEVFDLMRDPDPAVREAALCASVSHPDWHQRTAGYAKSHPQEVIAGLPLLLSLDDGKSNSRGVHELIDWLSRIGEPGFQPLVGLLGDKRAEVRLHAARTLYEAKLATDANWAHRLEDPIDRVHVLMTAAGRGQDPYNRNSAPREVIATCLEQAIRKDRASRVRAMNVIVMTNHMFNWSSAGNTFLLLVGLSDEQMFKELESGFLSRIIRADRLVTYGLKQGDPDVQRGALRLVTGDFLFRQHPQERRNLAEKALRETSVLQPIVDGIAAGPPECVAILTEVASSNNAERRDAAAALLAKIAQARKDRSSRGGSGGTTPSGPTPAASGRPFEASMGPPGPVTRARSHEQGAYGPLTPQDMIRRYGAPAQVAAEEAAAARAQSHSWLQVKSLANALLIGAWVLILLTRRSGHLSGTASPAQSTAHPSS